MYLPARKKRAGFFPIIGLVTTAFLAVAVFVGAAFVSNPENKFDIRQFAKNNKEKEEKPECPKGCDGDNLWVYDRESNSCKKRESKKCVEERVATNKAVSFENACIGVCVGFSDSCPESLVPSGGACNNGKCCEPPGSDLPLADPPVEGEGDTGASGETSQNIAPEGEGGSGTYVPHNASLVQPDTASLARTCVQTCVNKGGTAYTCASQCKVDASRQAEQTETTTKKAEATPCNFLACPAGQNKRSLGSNLCDCVKSATGNQSQSAATGISGTAGGTVKPPVADKPLTEIDSSLKCLQNNGVWIFNACQEKQLNPLLEMNRLDRADGETCTTSRQCTSGSCHVVGFNKKVCTLNVNTPAGQTERFADASSCKGFCAGKGGDEETCLAICGQYATKDENLLAVGQALDQLTLGTFSDYVAANVEANQEGLFGWERYTDPEVLRANAAFGTVLTAEGALAYTGIGALTGAGSAATFGTTANLVNTGYSAYQAQQACAGAITQEEKKNCAFAIGYAALAAANLGTSGLSLAAQGSDDAIRAAQLANQARIANGLVSTAEIGTNVYQTAQLCAGENATSTQCLITAGLTLLHGAGSYADIAYTANQANNYLNESVLRAVGPDISLAQVDLDEIQPINDFVVNRDDLFVRQIDDPESLLAEHITGLNPVLEPEQLAARIIDDAAIFRSRYNLPPLEMRIQDPVEYMRRLRQIAAREGIAIRPFHEYEDFFNQNSAGGVYNSVLNQIVVKPSTNPDLLTALRTDAFLLEHELIHGLQNSYYPSMPIELMEYEAYLSNLSPNFLDSLSSDPYKASNPFYRTLYSTQWWYENKGLVPQWLPPGYNSLFP